MSALRLSSSLLATESPPIPLARKWAASYPGNDGPLIDLSQGIPRFPPPESLRSSLAKAVMDPEMSKYGPIEGLDELREALASEMRERYRRTSVGSDGEEPGDVGVTEVDVNESDVAITAGCNLAFVATMMVLAGRGDEVILPVPWYFNHKMALDMLGISTIRLSTDPSAGFLPNLDEARRLITARTKAIVLVTPNNPTGAIYPPSLLDSFAQLAADHNIALVLDETYRDYVPEMPPHSLFRHHAPPAPPHTPTQPSSWRHHIIHLFSFSKSYHIPGYRLGAIVADSDSLMPHVRTVLDTVQICPSTAIQHALAPLMPSLRPFLHDSSTQLQTLHAVLRTALPPAWKLGSSGGYFAFVKHPFDGVPAEDVCQRLAEEKGVLCLPASFFGLHRSTDWIRVSVAGVSENAILEFASRISVFTIMP